MTNVIIVSIKFLIKHIFYSKFSRYKKIINWKKMNNLSFKIGCSRAKIYLQAKSVEEHK